VDLLLGGEFPPPFLIYSKDKEDGRRGRRRIEEKLLLDWYLRLMSFF
jgi:uncharacterized membrane protein YsdA (DUF1294 family)